MYPNLKTTLGKRLYMLLSACAVYAAIVYLFIVAMPFIPQGHSTGFIQIPPILSSLILALALFPILICFWVIILCIKRLICVLSNEKTRTKHHIALNTIYCADFLSAISSIILWSVFLFKDTSALYSFAIGATLLTHILLIPIYIIDSKTKKEIPKPEDSLSIKGKPAFVASVIILVVVLLFLPIVKETRVSYEYDPNDFIYERRNAFAYSYISVENRNTGEKVSGKLVIFPSNYKETSDIMKLK